VSADCRLYKFGGLSVGGLSIIIVSADCRSADCRLYEFCGLSVGGLSNHCDCRSADCRSADCRTTE
jgi:hypothetical protein